MEGTPVALAATGSFFGGFAPRFFLALIAVLEYMAMFVAEAALWS